MKVGRYFLAIIVFCSCLVGQEKRRDVEDEDISIDMELSGGAKKRWTLMYKKGEEKGKVTFKEDNKGKKGEVSSEDILKAFQRFEKADLFDLENPKVGLCSCVAILGKMKITKGKQKLDVSFRYERSVQKKNCALHDRAEPREKSRKCEALFKKIADFIEDQIEEKEEKEE